METHDQTQPLSAISAQNQPALNTLFNPHPLAQEPKETRSHYLSMLALGLVTTEPITGAQCLAFHHLAASLGLDEGEANQYCDGQKTIRDKGGLDFLQEVNYRVDCCGWIYRLDLAWLQTIDGLPSLKTQLNMHRICGKLDEGLKVRSYSNPLHFALLIRAQDKQAIISEMERMLFMVPSLLCLEFTALAAGMERQEIKACFDSAAWTIEHYEQNRSTISARSYVIFIGDAEENRFSKMYLSQISNVVNNNGACFGRDGTKAVVFGEGSGAMAVGRTFYVRHRTWSGQAASGAMGVAVSAAFLFPAPLTGCLVLGGIGRGGYQYFKSKSEEKELRYEQTKLAIHNFILTELDVWVGNEG